MNLIGVPVPPGFTITTDVCNEYFEKGKEDVVALLKDEVEKAREKSKGSSRLGFFRNLLHTVERMSRPKYAAITSRSKTASSLINVIRILIFSVSFL